MNVRRIYLMKINFKLETAIDMAIIFLLVSFLGFNLKKNYSNAKSKIIIKIDFCKSNFFLRFK